MSRWFVLAMAYLRFLPLWLIVIAANLVELYVGHVSLTSWVMFGVYAITALIAISWAIVVINLRGIRHDCTKLHRTISSYHEKKTECAEFMLTYLLPIIGFDCKSVPGLILLAIFFFIVASIYARHFYWQTNIVLEWMGYSMYKCVVTDADDRGSCVLVLLKGTMEGCLNRDMALYKVNEQTYFAFRKED